MGPEHLAAGALFGSLMIYALTGGADFGGGVWDLFASGPRAKAQRGLIARAIAPIWEANHVWLILAVVILFSAFPPAFAALCTALHVPLALMLLGIVMRGSAFAFRSYGPGPAFERGSDRLFAVSSLLTPVMLGAVVGAIASGKVSASLEPRPLRAYFDVWLAPFPLALGAFTLCLFAFLAAVYLTVEAEDKALREDFRARGLASGAACAALAWLSLWLANRGGAHVVPGLTAGLRAAFFHASTAAAAVGALWALHARRFRLARVLAAAQVALVVGGWALAQAPYLVPPEITITSAAAPRSVLLPLLAALGAGLALVVPAFLYLFRVFKPR
jgi:cytochrome d ubiquinol oxidase subunit II